MVYQMLQEGILWRDIMGHIGAKKNNVGQKIQQWMLALKSTKMLHDWSS